MTLNASAIRDLLKTRTHLRRAGYPVDDPAITALQGIIAEYRGRVGLATYLSEMLGPLAVLPMGAVKCYGPDGEEMIIRGEGRVIDELRIVRNLPWVVKAERGERYL